MQFTVEHIGLAARDTTALKDWYVRVLSAEVLLDNGEAPPAFFLRLAGGMILEIYPALAAEPATAHNGLAGWRHLALQVEAIEPACAALIQSGVRLTEPIKPAGGGGRVRFFSDPEGNLLHLIERPSGSVFRRLEDAP